MEETSRYIRFLAWLKVVKYTMGGVAFILLALLAAAMIG